jgi:hypothetical protein
VLLDFESDDFFSEDLVSEDFVSDGFVSDGFESVFDSDEPDDVELLDPPRLSLL